jgi:hypothetical protein
MPTLVRKFFRTLKRKAAAFGGKAKGAEPNRLEVQIAPVVPVAANTASAPVCPACGVAAGIRETLDVLDGRTAGECMACRALRLVE